MRVRVASSLLPCACLCSLAGHLTCQAPPGEIKGMTTSQVLSQSNFANLGIYHMNATSRRLRQVSVYRLASDAAGQWTCCLTVNGVVAKYGNTSLNSSGYVIMGTLDEVKGTFTPNTLAAALNDASGGNFGLMLHGRFAREAVLDRADGVYYASRASHLVAFPAPKKVQGITQTYVDPALGIIGGKLHLIYVDTFTQNGQTRSRIIAQEFDSSVPRVVPNTAKTITNTSITGSGTIIVHSPTPILDSLGNMHGLWLAERFGSDSDMFFKGDLTAAHAQQKTVDSGTWLNNGAIGSGRLYFAGSGAIHYVDTAWLVGDRVPVGSTGRLVGAVRDQLTGPNVTILLLSAKPIPAVQVPGIAGKLGLDLGTLFVLGSMVHSDASERVELPVPVPNDAGLKGLIVWLQGLAIDRAGSAEKATFTSTTTLEVQ